MIQANQIKPEMPVVCSKDGALGVVDHMEGADTIKLKKDSKGQHHFIPLSWVKTLDAKVHIDRPGEQAMKEWSDNAPDKGDKGAKHDGAKHDGKGNGNGKPVNGKGSPGAAPEMRATVPVPPPSDPAPSSPTKASSTKPAKH